MRATAAPVLALVLALFSLVGAWSPGTAWVGRVGRALAGASLASALSAASPSFATPLPVDPNDPVRLARGLKEVNYLLKNWEAKTTLCNYGEIKKELLENGNEEELYAAAKKGSLWDKGEETMNVMCKRDPEVVRAFVGLTNENLVLKNAEKLMRKPDVLDRVSADDVEAYEENVDAYILAVSEVDQLAYAARTDHDSTETFSKAQGGQSLKAEAGSDYLGQSRLAVIKVQKALEGIVTELHLLD